MIVIIGASMYILRWKIRWQFYKLKRSLRKQYQSEDINLISVSEHFDAYVVHNEDEDRHWVINVLIPKVENEWDMKLFVGLRDFPAGGAIADNIFDGIDSSRKVILIITGHFLTDEWCLYAMHMALTRGYHTIIPCLIEHLNPNKNRALKTLPKPGMYLQWTDDDDGQALFWNRLRDALQN